MTDTAYVTGNTVPIEAHLPEDLSDASTVAFKLYDDDEVVVDGSAFVVDASNGVVAYQWDDGETDRTGMHTIRWDVTWNGGADESFPKEGRDTIYFYD